MRTMTRGFTWHDDDGAAADADLDSINQVQPHVAGEGTGESDDFDDQDRVQDGVDVESGSDPRSGTYASSSSTMSRS